MVPPGKIRYVFSTPRSLLIGKDRVFHTEKTESKKAGKFKYFSSVRMLNYPFIKLAGKPGKQLGR